MRTGPWRTLEINGGHIEVGQSVCLRLPAGATGYADAQFDDYGGSNGQFRWNPGAMQLSARFSHPVGVLQGTAGFGFWNAPYGDPSHRRPALPRAAWFFYASAPNDLPFAPGTPGRGWFASSIGVTRAAILSLLPISPLVLALNQIASLRSRIWPAVREHLGLGAVPLELDMTEWHEYSLHWGREECRFAVDGQPVMSTSHSPHGPLGFVCWMDNQFLVLTPRGRIRSGVLGIATSQWMEVTDLWVSSGQSTEFGIGPVD